MTDPWIDKPGFDVVSLLWDDKTTDSAAKVYNADLMDAWIAKLRAHYEPIEKQAETLRFLFGDEGVKAENLLKIQMWREKAERWDQYAIYDNDNEPKILVKDLITAYEKLEAVREFVLSRRYDIKMDIENFGMLKPVLNYFLEEAEGR